ncbi:MAG: DUF885 family protein [Acidobacteriota bacterium]
MRCRPWGARCLMLVMVVAASACGGGGPAASSNGAARAGGRYEDLVRLFVEWREFESPPLVGGVPDYSAAAMAAQRNELTLYRSRLAAIDPSSWPVAQQIDYQLVLAEMTGLDFDHRVRRPWSRDPAFYLMIFPAQSDVPAHEGPVVHGWIDLWTYEYPLSAERAAELAARIRTIPALLTQARANLVEDTRDLWRGGIRAMAGQEANLDALAAKVAGTSADLDDAIRASRTATTEFRAWLEAALPSKKGPSGVGKDNYSYYIQRVHLMPYTWEDEVTIMRDELARAHASLKLEEHRNRRLPPLAMVETPEEYDKRFNQSVDDMVRFLDEAGIITPKAYMAPALRAKIGRFSPAGPDGLRGFFSEVSYRDPLAMRTHSYHWVELAMMAEEPHASPIRRVPSLYNIFDGRSEGMATGMEEWLMNAGMFDDNPRARELIYIMLAQRAARALGGLMMHANEWTIDQAVAFASEWTPRGWMPPDSETVWGEQHLYLQQPGYETSYIVGKIEIEKLMAARAGQLGGEFTLKRFIDELSAAGVIPVSLIRWELTGADDDVQSLGVRR